MVVSILLLTEQKLSRNYPFRIKGRDTHSDFALVTSDWRPAIKVVVSRPKRLAIFGTFRRQSLVARFQTCWKTGDFLPAIFGSLCVYQDQQLVTSDFLQANIRKIFHCMLKI